MQLEIVSTGDEVITGFITDTNVTYLCQELLSLGLQAYRRHTVGDKLEDIVKLLSERSKEADVILVNGGLGPTSDDNTTEAAAEAAGVKRVLNTAWLERIKAWHQERGRVMPENNVNQALLPEGAVMIDNPRGTACGFILKINKALCFFTPGVPSEFKAMYQNSIKPYLKEHLGLGAGTKVKRFFCFGVTESKMGQTLNALKLPQSIVLGYRAAYPLLEIKVIEHDAAQSEESAVIAAVRGKLKPYLILEDALNLSERIAALLSESSLVIFDDATAGLLAAKLASAVNIAHALISRDISQISAATRAELCAGSRWCYELTRADRGQEQHFVLTDLKEKRRWHYSARLNITLKDKKKDAVALVAASLLYETLAGLPVLQPDEANLKLQDN